jgi:FMN reductase
VLDHALRPLFSYLHAVVVPTGVFAASEDFGASDAQGGDLDKRIQRAASELAGLVAGGSAPVAPRTRRVEEELADPTPFEQLLRRASGPGLA